ncbi:hypothetical protein GUJ93_ZPchr0006g46056 [Zizania palustris]|uniref:Uncharacterized protein n=1 Tax=Zizania palustris TaxID=103762 RepID=A0A8J5VLV5_ZIZPA|nr:hypothetical protein GUJ93_ZPchr0006g46056 [Zizania palustris]
MVMVQDSADEDAGEGGVAACGGAVDRCGEGLLAEDGAVACGGEVEWCGEGDLSLGGVAVRWSGAARIWPSVARRLVAVRWSGAARMFWMMMVRWLAVVKWIGVTRKPYRDTRRRPAAPPSLPGSPPAPAPQAGVWTPSSARRPAIPSSSPRERASLAPLPPERASPAPLPPERAPPAPLPPERHRALW